jgi:pyrroline-5-carboxylate reductase
LNKDLSNIEFIGAGNMAGALIAGLVKNKYNNSQIFVSSPGEEHLKKLKDNFSVNVTKDNVEVVKSASTLVLAVKPNVIESVLGELSDEVCKKDPLLISIVAGYKIVSIEINKGSFLHTSSDSSPNTDSITFGLTASTRVDADLTTSTLSLVTLTEKLSLSFFKCSSPGELTKICELLYLFFTKPAIRAPAILPAPINSILDKSLFNFFHQKF